MNEKERKRKLEEEIKKLQEELNTLENKDDQQEAEEYIARYDPYTGEPLKHPRKIRVKKTQESGLHTEPLTTKQKEEMKTIKDNIKKHKEKLKKEIEKMGEKLQKNQEKLLERKKEMRELKRKIRNKERELRSRYHSDYLTWDIDMDEEIESYTSDLEEQLSDYTRAILSSVADGLRTSMGITIDGADKLGNKFKDMSVKIGEIGKKIGEKFSNGTQFSIGPKIPEERLEEFYEIGADLVSAIGDSNRLRILKGLEQGPKYQKELSEITQLRGGALRHHLDTLMDKRAKFVIKEAVGNRYLLTTRGREALKLAEMMYMRYLNKQHMKQKDDNESQDFDVPVK